MFRNCMERLLVAGTEGMDLEKAALLRRLNAFFLFAGVTFLALTLALIVVWFLDPTQYMLALYTCGTGVGILLVRSQSRTPSGPLCGSS